MLHGPGGAGGRSSLRKERSSGLSGINQPRSRPGVPRGLGLDDDQRQLNGLDDIGQTLRHMAAIERFERSRAADCVWLPQ
jgi:hypothetical protein